MTAGLATALGLALASGFNAWAAILVFGGIARIDPSFLPGPMAEFLSAAPILTIAAVLFLLEFFADKIPRFDHAWNLVQTFLCPLAGAALALASVPGGTSRVQVMAALLGAGVTLAAHVAKLTARFTSTAAVSGWSQIAISIAEDIVAVCIAAVAIFAPEFSLPAVVAVVALLAILFGKVRHAVGILFFVVVHPRRALREAAHGEEPKPSA